MTITLIGLNGLVFVLMVLRGASAFNPTPQQAIAFGADFGPLTLSGQWWRLLTSMFVHFGIIHIGLNMWCLWNLGRAAEQLMGRFSYLLTYIVSGIFGSIASVFWQPMATGAGASGAIFGLAGTLVSYVYLRKTPSNLQLNKRFLSSVGMFIVYNLAFGAAIPFISNAAHMGGCVMGLVVGALLPSASATESIRRLRLSLVVGFSAIAVVGSAIAAKRLRPGVSEIASIRQLMVQGKADEALLKLQELTAREPQFAQAQAMLGVIYYEKKQYPEAISAFEKARSADPNNVLHKKLLAYAYLMTGKFDQAMVLYNESVVKNPKDSEAHLGLGQAYSGMKRYDIAISEFSKAMALDPKAYDPQFALAQAQFHIGQNSDAEETLRRMLVQFPNDAQVKAALEFMKQHTH